MADEKKDENGLSIGQWKLKTNNSGDWALVVLIILGALLFGDNEHDHDLTDALICAVHTYGECK